MYELQTETPARPASLKRAVECQLFLTYLVQQMRNAPRIVHELDVDELRQLEKAAGALHQEAKDALDVAISARASARGG